jgi:hypothetical protein
VRRVGSQVLSRSPRPHKASVRRLGVPFAMRLVSKPVFPGSPSLGVAAADSFLL